MQYELFLRRDDPLDPQQQQRLRERVARDDRVSAELFDREGEIVGVDLSVSTDAAGAAALLCEVAFELATELELAVFDPQLGALVLPDDRQQIIERIEQTSAFMAGVGLGPPGSTPVSITRGKLWIYVAGVAMVLLLVGRLLTCSM